MKRTITHLKHTFIAILYLFVLASMPGTAWADVQFNKISGSLVGGDLVVQFKITGLGDSVVTGTLSGDVTCTNRKGHDDNAHITSSQNFTPHNGSTKGSISLSCPDSQRVTVVTSATITATSDQGTATGTSTNGITWTF